MKAAVVHAAGAPPRYEEFSAPTAKAGEVEVRVLAAGLHPLVRAIASGRHYSSSGTYPIVPGVDGVGRLSDGSAVYFSFPAAPYGTFAERAVAPAQSVIPLPANLDPVHAAGLVNPVMSSWLALRQRAKLPPGGNVLILGATGSAGRAAVQVARALGAGRVVAAGRNQTALNRLNADAALKVDAPDFAGALEAELAANGVDVVLDYLWGPPMEAFLKVFYSLRKRFGARRVQLVNIGHSAGAHVPLDPSVLRSTGLELLGSGLGSVAPPQMAQGIAELLEAAARGAVAVEVQPVPLAEVESAWTAPDGGKRVVFVP